MLYACLGGFIYESFFEMLDFSGRLLGFIHVCIHTYMSIRCVYIYTIHKSYICIYTNIIQAEASDDSRQISTAKSSPLFSRARTTAFADWVISDSWKWRAEEQESVDFSNVVNEVLSRPGWRSGNALTLIMRQKRHHNTLATCEVCVFCVCVLFYVNGVRLMEEEFLLMFCVCMYACMYMCVEEGFEWCECSRVVCDLPIYVCVCVYVCM
jgi:hypothetical protein